MWAHRDLIALLARRDFVLVNRRAYLGVVWHLLQPLLFAGTYVLVFQFVARLDTGRADPVLFQLLGVVLWNYFHATYFNCSNVFIANAPLLAKAYFPRLVLVIVVAIGSLIRLALNAVVFVVACFARDPDTLRWMGLMDASRVALGLACAVALGTGLGLLVASVGTRYRDPHLLMIPVMHLLLLCSCILYPRSVVPQDLQSVVELNPLVIIAELLRAGALNGSEVAPSSAAYACVAAGVVCCAGVVAFNYIEKSVVDAA